MAEFPSLLRLSYIEREREREIYLFIYLSIYVSQFVYPFTHQQILRSFPYLGHCEYCCNENSNF